ncbi:carbohydrate binding domain-containing protein [Streptomyces sp. NEAU-sy36]|uniref:carbohydrate binding domain-containing protein n=1 Tax=unclassified Streptomyces TaxID=2593676 RepID=UPI0015D5A070|nr:MULTISPECIES: carbohydrate binding domain-containing protein [unclassified Streptomyces]QLJ01916.1 carbohydrate binding domain-containing protein [Streptomyces sp. NEAU-sy36]
MHLARLAASVCALALAATGAAVAAAPASDAATAAAAGSVYSVAPYVDMSNGQEGLLDTAITGHHLKAYTAAFVLGEGCNQVWGDTLPIGNDSYTDPEIARAKAEGASVIISSGGASGLPLAWTCTTQSSIDAGYQALIDDYGVTQLDFDVEGAAVADTAAAARQMQAMKDLKAANPDLRFSVTLPVLTSGLTNDGVNILKAAKNAGVRIDVVNIMAMDYYAGTGTEMGQGAIDAARSTLAQMQSVDSGYGYANLGITPMIGKNDDGSTFTLADAQTVENFAAQNGVGRLSFWSVNRDQPCGGSANSLPTCSEISQSSLAFTDAFVPYEGSAGGGGGGGTTSDFSLSLAPGSASVAQGGTATATVTTATTSGSAESVALAASGAPSGVTVSFSPASVTSGGTSTLTADVGSSVAAGTYPITVTGTGTGGRHSATYTLTVTSSGGGGGTDGGSLTNAGFEAGGLGPWTCTGGSTLVAAPVHSGSHALQITPDSAGTGECDQTVTLSPNHTYTLTGWVQGPYAYLGVNGGATASTWSSGSSWNQLKVSFTTGASGTVTVYVHGWYGQGNVYADDLALS